MKQLLATSSRGLVALLALPNLALASDVVVSSGGSIQAGIDAAVDGDRVLVQAGTYFESIDFDGKKIEVIGVDGPLATTIDATGLGEPCAKFWSAEDAASVLRGFTLANGQHTDSFVSFGGGISAFQPDVNPTIASPFVEDCIITDCFATWGAGAFTNGVLRRCVIAGNGSSSQTHGGGVAGKTMQVVECVLADNDAYEGAGGYRQAGAGTALFQDCVITGNRAGEGGSGGGLELEGATTIDGCRISGNAITWGGMFANLGSGVNALGSGVTISRSTIAGNTCTASFFGPNVGGVTGPATIVDSIVRDNCELELNVATATYSNVSGGWAGTGNFDADPLFVDAAGGDYHLRAGSPCIGAGDPLGVDPDGTAADVGAHFFQTMYVRDNTAPAQWAAPGWPGISSQIGGKTAWRVHGGAALAGQTYGIAGSLSGTSPGVAVLGATLPLVPDGYFAFSIHHANLPPFSGTFGVLDAGGNGDASFTVPSGFPTLVGVTVWHAGLVVDLAGPAATLATNAVALTFE